MSSNIQGRQIYALCQLGAALDSKAFEVCDDLAFVGPQGVCVADKNPPGESSGAYLEDLQIAIQDLCDSRGLFWQVSRPGKDALALAIVGPITTGDKIPAIAMLRAYIQLLQNEINEQI